MFALEQDLRFACRQMRKAPSFALTIVLTLALGIGANTAIFSLVNSVLLKPLPVAHPEQITMFAPRQNDGPLQQTFSWPEFKEIRAQSRNSFSDVFAVSLGLDGLAVEGHQPERIMTSYVSGNLFDALGLKPTVGRLLLSSEGEVPGRDPVMVLDYNYWKERFNGDPNVVGRQVTIDGHPVTIVGVAPKGFHGVQSFVTMAAYLPLAEMTVEGTPVDVLNSWRNRDFAVYGRLRQGVSIGEANAQLRVIAQTITRLHPDVEKKLSITVFPEPSIRINTGDPKTMFVIAGLFLALAGMVLLLACVNVANLILVRATAREREMAIRTALGAQSSRLLFQMITESITLAVLGGAVGIVLGMWATSLLGHVNPHADLPVRLSPDFDWRIFLYSLSIALMAGLVVGIVPALRIARTNVNAVLHEGSRSVASGRHLFRDGLVTLQIASSLVLLVVAGLFVRSLSAMQTTDLGYKTDHVLNLSIDPSQIGMNGAQTRDLARSIVTRLHQLARVESVSHASSVPMGYFNNGGDALAIDGAAIPASPSTLSVDYNVVSPEYFKVMGISLLRGRSFTDSDDEHSRDVAVISEATAKKYWPNQDPVGRTFRLESDKTRKVEVVGVARDAEFQLYAGGKSRPYLYLPYAQHFAVGTLMIVQLKTQGDPLALAPAVEKAIHSLAPQLPVFQVETMGQALYTLNGLLLFQIAASLAAIMGGLGLTLAVVGLYGLISYAVSQRIHEIGLRMALGASRRDVLKMIYRQSAWIVAAGLCIGLLFALGGAQAVGSLVIVSVYDPAIYMVVATTLGLVALASCYLPARRAMRVEPMVALRQD